MGARALAAAVLAAGATALATHWDAREPTDAAPTLVQLQPGAGPAATRLLAARGATEVVPELRLYRLPRADAAAVLPGLRALSAVRYTGPDRPLGSLAVARLADEPLVADEWWRGVIGITGLEPPGPGVPVTIVDSGIDVTHPEFAGRPDLTLLNTQEPEGVGGRHGTGVASVVGAPVNGLGIAGIYPQAVLRSWDAANGEGLRLRTSEIVGGILAAARQGRGVVNLSLGGPGAEQLIRQAVAAAVRRDVLVVAASGNNGPTGPVTYPAGYPHVLTVGATDRDGAVARFSSRSRFVDLVAPGADITTAWPINGNESPAGFRSNTGTSFSAPLVAGAAAWVWTSRLALGEQLDASQMFEIMRRSATDLDLPGRDQVSGFGLLNVAAALSAPAPVRDPLEPNETPALLQPGGLAQGISPVAPLTTKQRRTTRLVARLDAAEDPRDVYRVWVARKAGITVTTQATTDVDLSLWRGDAYDLSPISGSRVARANAQGVDETMTFANDGLGAFFFLSVAMPSGTRDAEYSLRIGR